MIKRDFNKVIITGCPTAAPELKLTTAGTPVMNFTLSSMGVKRTEYVDVTVWGELAENVHKGMEPGSRIMVEGTLHRQINNEGECGSVEITANRIFAIGGNDGAEIY